MFILFSIIMKGISLELVGYKFQVPSELIWIIFCFIGSKCKYDFNDIVFVFFPLMATNHACFLSLYDPFFFELCRALLHFLDPDKFRSKDDFVQNYKNLSSFNENEVCCKGALLQNVLHALSFIYIFTNCKVYLFCLIACQSAFGIETSHSQESYQGCREILATKDWAYSEGWDVPTPETVCTISFSDESRIVLDSICYWLFCATCCWTCIV